MLKFIGGITVAILFITQANMTVKGGDVGSIRNQASEIGEEFSQAALESVKTHAGADNKEAARKYEELANNETLINVSDIPYRGLGGHAAFGAEMAEHMLWGGATFKQTRRTVLRLAKTYGKALVNIFNGSPVAGESQIFMMDLTQALGPRHLNPDEYRLTIKSAKGQFGALYKIFKG